MEHLEIGVSFDQSVDKLPKSLKILKIGYHDENTKFPVVPFWLGFNKSIENIPDSITELYL